MSSKSIKDKVVRPGSFNGMYYYSSDRHQTVSPPAEKTRAKRPLRKAWLIAAILVMGGAWFVWPQQKSDEGKKTAAIQADKPAAKAPAVTAKKTVNYCAENTLDKFVRISVDKRHLWACQGSQTVYDTVIITGLRGHPETETPVGTYKIYGKMTNTTLTGSDSRGSWSDPVYYWMPFLDNQYGTYGFHDATWRKDSEFGSVSPDSSEASHGCIELPLAASQWLYEWAPVGTIVTVES